MKKYITLLLLIVYALHAQAQITITANTSAPFVQYALNVDGVLWNGSNGTVNTTYPSPTDWTSNRTLTFADRDELQAYCEQFGINFETAKTICWQIRAKDRNCKQLSCIGRWSSVTTCTRYEAQPQGGGVDCDDCVELAAGDIRTENGVMLIDICEVDVITGACLSVVNTLTWTPDMTNYTYASPDGSIITNVVPDPANPGDFIVQQTANINNVNVTQTGNEVTITVDGQDPVCVQACCDAPPCLDVNLTLAGAVADNQAEINNAAIEYMNANGCGAGSTFFVREANCPRVAITTLTPGATNILTRINIANTPLSLTCPVDIEMTIANKNIIEESVNACFAGLGVDATYVIDTETTPGTWRHVAYTQAGVGSLNLIWSRDGLQRNQLLTTQCSRAEYEADANCNIVQTAFIPDVPVFTPHAFTSTCERDGSVIIELSGALDDVTIEPIETRLNADGSTSLLQCGVEVGTTAASLTCDEIRQEIDWSVRPGTVNGQGGNQHTMTMCGALVTSIFVPTPNTNTLDTLAGGIIVLYENGVEVSTVVVDIPDGFAEMTVCNEAGVRIESTFPGATLTNITYTNATGGTPPCTPAQINTALQALIAPGAFPSVSPCSGYLLTYANLNGNHVVTFGGVDVDGVELPGFLTYTYTDAQGRVHEVTEGTYCETSSGMELVSNPDGTGLVIDTVTGDTLCVELCCDGVDGGTIDAATVTNFVNTEPEATNAILAHMLRFGYGPGTTYTFGADACAWVTVLPYGSLYALRNEAGTSSGPSGQFVGTGDINDFVLSAQGLYVNLGMAASVTIVDDGANWILSAVGNVQAGSYWIALPGGAAPPLSEYFPTFECDAHEWTMTSDCNLIKSFTPENHNTYSLDSEQGRDTLYLIENGDTIRTVALNKACCPPVNMELEVLSSGAVLAPDATDTEISAYINEYFVNFPFCENDTKFYFGDPGCAYYEDGAITQLTWQESYLLEPAPGGLEATTTPNAIYDNDGSGTNDLFLWAYTGLYNLTDDVWVDIATRLGSTTYPVNPLLPVPAPLDAADVYQTRTVYQAVGAQYVQVVNQYTQGSCEFSLSQGFTIINAANPSGVNVLAATTPATDNLGNVFPDIEDGFSGVSIPNGSNYILTIDAGAIEPGLTITVDYGTITSPCSDFIEDYGFSVSFNQGDWTHDEIIEGGLVSIIPASTAVFQDSIIGSLPVCTPNKDVYISDCDGGIFQIESIPTAAAAGNTNTLEYNGNLVLYENGAPVDVVQMNINNDPLSDCADIVLGDQLVSVQKCCPDVNGGVFSLYDLGVDESSTQQEVDSVIAAHMLAGGYGAGTEYGFTQAVCTLAGVDVKTGRVVIVGGNNLNSIDLRLQGINDIDMQSVEMSATPNIPNTEFIDPNNATTNVYDFLLSDMTPGQVYTFTLSGTKINGLSFDFQTFFVNTLAGQGLVFSSSVPFAIADGCTVNSAFSTQYIAGYQNNQAPLTVDPTSFGLLDLGDGTEFSIPLTNTSFTVFNAGAHEYTSTGIYDLTASFPTSQGDVFLAYDVAVIEPGNPESANAGKKFVIGDRCEVVPVEPPLPCFLPCDYDPCGQIACTIDLNSEGMTSAATTYALEFVDSISQLNDCGRGSQFVYDPGQCTQSVLLPRSAGSTYTNIELPGGNICPINYTYGNSAFANIKSELETCFQNLGYVGTVGISNEGDFFRVKIYNSDVPSFTISGVDGAGVAYSEQSAIFCELHVWRINDNCDLVKVETPPTVPISASNAPPCPEQLQGEVIVACPGDPIAFPVYSDLYGNWELERPDGSKTVWSSDDCAANTMDTNGGYFYEGQFLGQGFWEFSDSYPAGEVRPYIVRFLGDQLNACSNLEIEASCQIEWNFYVLQSNTCRKCDCEFSKNTTFFTADGPIVDGFEVDTLYEITKIKTECCIVHTDTIKQWSNTFCAEGAVCEATTRNFYDTGSADCYTMFDTDFLQFNYEARLEGTSECNSENDGNNDRLTVTPSGSIVSSGGGFVTSNYFEPGGTNWVLTVAAGATITHSIEGSNVNNNGIDFLATPLSRAEVVDTTCTPVCFPPETAVFAGELNTTTGEFPLTIQMTSPSGIVGPGECFDIEIVDNTTIPPTDLTSLLPVPWHGVTGQPLSSIDGFDATIFTDGTETIEHNAVFEVNKFALNELLGLEGLLSTQITFNILVGGVCDEVAMPMFANQSTENHQDDVCKVVTFLFDNNANMETVNGVAVDVDGITTFPDFANSTYATPIGGLKYASTSSIVIDSGCSSDPLPGSQRVWLSDVGRDWVIDYILDSDNNLHYMRVPTLDVFLINDRVHNRDLNGAIATLSIFDSFSSEITAAIGSTSPLFQTHNDCSEAIGGVSKINMCEGSARPVEIHLINQLGEEAMFSVYPSQGLDQ